MKKCAFMHGLSLTRSNCSALKIQECRGGKFHKCKFYKTKDQLDTERKLSAARAIQRGYNVGDEYRPKNKEVKI